MAKNGSNLPKRKLSAHQKQVRFFTVFFTILLSLVLLGLLLLVNRPR